MFNLQGLSVYLVGMMGSGKSTVGPLLATNLGYSFLDTDTTIARACAQDLGYSFEDPDLDESELVGKIITEIFQTAGEAEFRRIETQILAEVSAYTRLVFATGGGIVIDRENWNHLHQGLVIWLDPSLDLLVERLQDDTTRPILATPEELQPKLDRILTERRDKYAEADIHIPFTHNLTPEEIVDRILAAIPTVLKTPVAIPE
ncbi:shikimate kinase [Chamaesiphon sp. VAR_48_metabat_403]|uniref:shikimate kinase n=1 Tax=Chamaesiphon sp. VAR_48_metabat_403 TaxID=2964700 RepID=UPI0037C0EFE2